MSIENDYFKDNGLSIELILTSGADNVAAAVLSDDVEIGFAGPESAIYVYKGGEKDYLQVISGLTKRDGQFILSRTKNDNFKIEDIKNKHILVGRTGGMPALNFLNALDNNNIPYNEVNIDYSVDFADLTSAFISGNADYVNLFEPNATKLEENGYGYVVGSVGEYSGCVPYTTFYARLSYINNNEKIINSFNKSINEGLKYVKENTSEKIAKAIHNQFKDMTLNELTTIVQRYKDADSWLDNNYVTEESFKNLQDIMINSNNLDTYVNYNDLINTPE